MKVRVSRLRLRGSTRVMAPGNVSSFSRDASDSRSRKRLIRLTNLFLILSLLTGCAVDEDAEVARYRKILDRDVPGQVNFAAGEPLTLETALLLANQHNEQLARAGEDYVQALVDKDRAAAAFYPTVSFIPSFSLADDSTDRGNGRSGEDVGNPGDPDDQAGGGRGSSGRSTGDSNLDVPVNLRMNLFNGFRDAANVRRTGAEIERREALLLDLQATVLLDVAQTYYQVLRSQQSADVLRNSLKVQEERVRDARGRAQAGLARNLDVAQTEAQAAGTRVSLIAAESNVRNGRTVLTFLTNAPVADSALVDELALPPQLPTLDDALSQAASTRQDLVAATAGVQAAAQSVQQSVGQYYPSVTLNVNQFLYRESSPDDSNWNSLISANLPLFTGGVIHANVRAALSRLRQAKLDESLARREVEQDVRLAYEDFAASAQRMQALRVQLAAARTALNQAEQSYRAGLGTNLDRLSAQDQALSAELQLSSELYNQKVFYLNLLRVVGRLGTTVEVPVAPALPADKEPGTQPAP
jgi:outer membrane protein TolC